ncbi:MAG: HIT family protein [Alphaproteobacteria bacterium]|nr:HIT family protein [Alphaproteobacteria bacterium]
MFAIDPRITRSAAPFLDLPLSTVLLKDDARWPWLVLVPRVANAQELTDLSDEDAARLLAEIRLCARAIGAEPRVERTNIGALGNVVPQLHIHVVGRWVGDAAWPGPVWGVEGKVAYDPADRAARIARITDRLTSDVA